LNRGENALLMLGMLKRLAEFPRHAFFLALPVPLLVLALAAWLGSARGSFYLGSNSDPDYVYLLNSLGLLQGHSPNHTDHPGTPVQAVGALVAAITYAVSGSGGLVEDVLARPEHYLGVLNAVFAAACALTFLVVGLATYSLIRGVLPSTSPQLLFPAAMMVLMQLMPLLAVSDMLALTVVRPEPWLMCLSMALGVVLLGLLAEPARMESAKTGKWLGVIVGVGVAAKVTFLPLALIPLVVLRGRWPRVAFVMWTVLALFISLIPILPRARQVARWFVHLAFRKGAYGSGDPGLIETSSILPGLKLLAPAEPVFLATLALCWLVLLVLWIKWRVACHRGASFQPDRGADAGRRQAQQSRTDSWHKAGLSVLLALCIAGLAQFLFAAKRPVPHYMLPAFSLMGAQVVVVLCLLGRAALDRARNEAAPVSARGKLFLLSFSVLVLCAAVFAGREAWRQHERMARQRDVLLALERESAEAVRRGRTVCYYRCSSPVYALNFGNEFCGRFFAEALAKNHPDALFYDAWKRDFNSFHGLVSREEILKRLASGPLFLWGSAWETYPPEARPPELNFQARSAAGQEVLYQAVPAR